MTATAATLRRNAQGRFAPRPTFPTCGQCGWTLAETLTGRLRCPHRTCDHYGVVAGVVPGVQLGRLAELVEVAE